MRNKKRILVNLPFTAIALVSLVFFYVIGAYILKFGMDGKGRQEEWAQFGEYFGGVLGPILGFITVIGVLLTYELQRR